MHSNSICTTEKLTFLKYLNEHYLFYSITLVTFVVLFSLVWILKTYTYFEKHRVTRASIPKFPYGNFGPVLKKETSLHLFLWKTYNRFKRKGCKFGGLFLFMKPVILQQDPLALSNASYQSILPKSSRITQEECISLLSEAVQERFVNKYECSGLAEKLLKNQQEYSSILKEYLLESLCMAFGLKPFQMLDEINYLLLKHKRQNSFKYFLLIGMPLLRSFVTKAPFNQDIQEILIETMENRKKNDLEESDLMQSFMKLYNVSNYSLNELAEEYFSLFTDCLLYCYSTSVFCLYELAVNEEIQREVIGEVRRFNKKHRRFTWDGLKELKYVEAVVKETLRKYPPVATTIQLSTDKKVQHQQGWYPEHNSLIFHSILGIHRDPQYYIKPEAFDPDRFTEKRLFTENTFVPFGLGASNQFYFHLVRLQVMLIVLSIFSSVEVKVGTTGTPLKYDPNHLYLKPSDDLELNFVKM